MSDKIVNLKKDNKEKKPSGFNKAFKRVMWFVFIYLIFVQIYNFYTGASLLERKHHVFFFKEPIDISNNYFESMNGKRFTFNDFKGDNVIISFWAPWCRYCSVEVPEMSRIADRLNNMGYQIVPITKNIEPRKDIERFYSRRNIAGTEPYITGDRELYQKLRVSAIPQFFLVNSNGQAVAEMRPNWAAGDIFTLFSELKKATLMQDQERFQGP
jgi:thiol-disulfide isomerase/thioredoxin